MDNLERLERIALALPEAERVDVEAWGDHPTFRVRGKNFVFADGAGSGFSVKLPLDEAAALVASDPAVVPEGYGLGKHGWVGIHLTGDEEDERWEQLTEWIRTSYTLIAPKKLSRQLG
jgi:predicted DNA-binding protein (MmcQ/YjbR family)